jgi:hypothetical protein
MQVRVNAFESDASFGHTGGGTANQITKQGTNTLHGSLYEFNQVSALAANQFFYNKAGIGKPVYRYNQYGLSASGPLWIPKIFNGRNRVFWLFAWEGLHDSERLQSRTLPVRHRHLPERNRKVDCRGQPLGPAARPLPNSTVRGPPAYSRCPVGRRRSRPHGQRYA